MSKLKCLVVDIETAPMTAYIWNLKDQYVDMKQLKTDWHVMAWGAKWLGDPPEKLIYRDQRNARRLENDKPLLQELWKLMNEADIIITMNGQAFDCPKLNARFMFHGMKPPKPYRHLDVYRIVKKVAAFTSNSLAYLTDKMCVKHKKITHGLFPGLSLWTECMKGNRQAWEEMRHYNIQDVLSTEEFYMKIRAWAPESMPRPYEAEKVSTLCKTCGEKGRMQRRGVALKSKFKYQRWQCQTCGGWATGDRVR
jgi:DNA polymerase elongation subunit (family B)